MSNNLKESLVTYFKGVRAEWGKVVWPEKPMVIANFVWVVVVCTFFTILIFSFDLIYDWIFKFIPGSN